MGEEKRTIAFSLAGRTYRVVSTASEEEILALARVVEERMRSIAGSRSPGMEALALAAVSLAHDAEANRKRAEGIANGTRQVLGKMLERIDSAVPPTEPIVPTNES